MFNRKEYMKKYWEEHKKYKKEYMKKWRSENKEKYTKHVNEYMKKWREEHKEKESGYNKNNYQKNKERYSIYGRKYRKTENGKAVKQRTNIKRRVRFKRILNTLTSQEWIDILKEYKFRCAYCGKEFNLFDKPERDHVIPISKGGNNIKENIVPACRSCNSKKHNKILINGGF